MDGNPESTEQDSQYPDPEQSGLSFPWLDKYQPVPADALAARLAPIVHEGFVPEQDELASPSGHALRNYRRPSFRAAEDGFGQPSAVLEDSEDDPEFVESEMEAE
jgi:hypothetical protein